jgi:hypothetical protein
LDAIRGIINKSHTVHFHDFSSQVNTGGMSGWFAQQVLKLKIASIVLADYYLVLDSKNTLIRDVESHSLVTKCNQAKIFGEFHIDAVPEPHHGWYGTTARLLGVPMPSKGYWPASISPMIFHRDTALQLLKTIGENESPYTLCSGPLCGWLREGATEFILYQLFSHFKTDVHCTHAVDRVSHEDPISVALWRGLNSNSDASREVAEHKVRPLFFGAQAGAMNGLWGAQKMEASDHFMRIYRDAGLYDGFNPPAFTFMDCVVGQE